jgi:chemotaxis methyl-accepting protein methylase
MILRRCISAYLLIIRRIWNHLPPSVRLLSSGQAYGRHVHAVVRLCAERRQYFATFFLRNRPELELMRRVVDRKPHGSSLDISVLACSKGPEVYSILWTIRSARPDLRLRMHAVDISREILAFAEKGVYSRSNRPDVLSMPTGKSVTERENVAWNTNRDQQSTIFERMTDDEIQAMFEIEGDEARVKSWLKEGTVWLLGDAGNPDLVGALGPQDIVVANRFLCHMKPPDAERCLRNVARLVKPGGYLFVSGLDLDVRTKVAKALGWKPVTDLMRDIHEGDDSLRLGWPLGYWSLEPLRDDRPDWIIRYTSVFQIGEVPLRTSEDAPDAVLRSSE